MSYQKLRKFRVMAGFNVEDGIVGIMYSGDTLVVDRASGLDRVVRGSVEVGGPVRFLEFGKRVARAFMEDPEKDIRTAKVYAGKFRLAVGDVTLDKWCSGLQELFKDGVQFHRVTKMNRLMC